MAGKSILAWHFLTDDCRLRGGGKIVKPGMVLKHPKSKPLIPCESGLHASVRLIDALQWAPGAMLCRVKCSGETTHHGNPADKLVCRRREVLWMLDATWYLHEFACRCAEESLKKTNVNHVASWQAIETKRKWLDGVANDDELAAARAAARAAAQAAAWDAAWDAAQAAARAAARDAARDAARAAAWAAARDAARAAAWAAARDAQNALLESLLNSAPWSK